MTRVFLAVLMLTACSAAAPPPPPAPTQAVALAGSWWQIESIDGRALEAPLQQAQRPHIVFLKRSYGAYVGCNTMSGLYVQRGNRVYAMPGPQTMMGCPGSRQEQDAAVTAVMFASPVVSGAGERISLRARGRTISLRRADPPRQLEESPAAWQGTRLAGQSFDLSRIDGDAPRPTPLSYRLDFADRTATLRASDGVTTNLGYRQDGDFVTFSGGKRERFGPFFDGIRLSLVSGPNGEILLAGDGHWLAGDNVRRDRPKSAGSRERRQSMTKR